MTLPFVAGLSYLNQLSKDNFRKPHHTVIGSGGNIRINENRFFGIGGEPLVGRIKPADNAYENTSTITSSSQWPHIPNATLQYGSYVYEDFVHGRTNEKISVRFFNIFFHLEDNTVKIMEQQANSAENISPKFLTRQRVPRPDNQDLFLTVYDFTVGKATLIYGRQHMIYCCDLYTRKTLTHMGFIVPEDHKPPFSQEMASAYIKPMVELIERHFNTAENSARFLQYDRQVLRFSGQWDDTKSMFGDRHTLLVHFYLADDTMEMFRKTPRSNGRDHWTPFIHRRKIPKKISDLKEVSPGAPWPVLKTSSSSFPSSRHPIKNYQLFDQAATVENIPLFTDTDLECGKSICVFGRTILLYDCDKFTKWFNRHKYGKEMHPILAPSDPKPLVNHLPCSYNNHGSEEDSIRNCQQLMPTPLVRDVRRYLLVDQDPEDPISLIFKAKMLSERPDDCNRLFLLTYCLNDDSICMKEKADPGGNWIGTFLAKRPVKSGCDSNTTLPVYLQAEDLFVGATVSLKGSVFVLAEADERTLRYMEKYREKFPGSDVRKAMVKLAGALPSGGGSELQRKLDDLNGGNPDQTVDWDRFVQSLTELAKSSLTSQEYLTIARSYYFYPYVSKEKRRELLRTHLQQTLRQNLWEPRRSLLSALIKIDAHSTGLVPREEMARAIKATKMPAKADLVSAYLDLVEEDRGVEYEAVVSDLDWIRNQGVALQNVPLRMEADFDYNKFFKEDQKRIRYRDFLLDLENAGA